MSMPDTREAVLRISNLPTLPSVLGKILATAADPDASALDLGKLIASDQSLSATLLKLVNSAYYGFPRRIASVSQAIVMLGFLEVRNLTLTATAFRSLAKSSSDYDRVQLWRHSIATATAAERCAKKLNIECEGCFESGLLHDIGKVALDLLFPEKFREAAHRAHQDNRRMAELEREVLGADHAEVGGILGEHWNLPPGVVEAIRYHHEPGLAKAEPALACLTAIANHAAYQADLGERSSPMPPEFPHEAAQRLGISEGQCEELATDLAAGRDKIDEFVSALRE